jgi:hypothetical protein
MPQKSSYVNAVPVFINKCRSDFKVNLLSIKYLNAKSGKNPLLQKYFLIGKNVQSNKTQVSKNHLLYGDSLPQKLVKGKNKTLQMFLIMIM